jgi:hypothetical protein
MSGKRWGIRLALGLCLLVPSLPTGLASADLSGAGTPPAASPSNCAGPLLSGPVANATPAGDNGITRELSSVVMALADCWNAGDWVGYCDFLTPDFMSARFGTTSPTTVALQLNLLATRRLLGSLTIDAAQYGRLISDASASIQVAWREGFARYRESWSFVRGERGWRLDAVSPLDIVMDAPAVGLRIELTDNGITSPLAEIAQTTFTVLEGVNETGGPFIMTVFALSTDVEPEAIVAGAPVDLLAGSAPIDSESSRDLVLENLPPGDYVIATGLEAAIGARDTSLLRWVRLTVTTSDGK